MPIFIEFCTMILRKRFSKLYMQKIGKKKRFQGQKLLHQLTNHFENFSIGPSLYAEQLTHLPEFHQRQRFLSYLQTNDFRPLCSIFSNGGHVFSWIINPNSHFVYNH